MLTKYYRQLDPKEKALADHKIAQRFHTDIQTLIPILQEMNPLIEIQNNKVVIFKNTLIRIQNSIKREMRS